MKAANKFNTGWPAMRKIIVPTLLVTFLFANNSSIAQENQNAAPKPAAAPPVRWISKNPSDVITINNGMNEPITVTINVNKSDNTTGISVRNCGTTNSIKSGSSAICSSQDADHPINFSMDTSSANQKVPVTGTYQVQQN